MDKLLCVHSQKQILEGAALIMKQSKLSLHTQLVEFHAKLLLLIY